MLKTEIVLALKDWDKILEQDSLGNFLFSNVNRYFVFKLN